MGGDLVGEMATLERKPRAATVISCAQTTAHLIPADLFIAFLEEHPGVHREVSRMLSERLRFADEQRVAFAALPAAARVARILLGIVQTYGRNDRDGHWELGISLSRADLASFAGVGLSSAEKALRGLRELGVLGQHGRKILIMDLLALRKAAADSAFSRICTGNRRHPLPRMIGTVQPFPQKGHQAVTRDEGFGRALLMRVTPLDTAAATTSFKMRYRPG